MFKKNKIKIIKDLLLDRPLTEWNDWDLDFFDREGYQLNRIEKAYHPNIFIDHAHILHRFGFTGSALDQLTNESNIYPKLKKLVFTKPKYGLDFAIDWIDEGQVIELFHIELDCREYEKFSDIVFKLETFIETTDWDKIYLFSYLKVID